MNLSLILAVAQALPGLVQTGFSIFDLVKHTGNITPQTPTEDFALEMMKSLPTMLSAGVDVLGYTTIARDLLRKMTAEKRGPSQDEWKEQRTRRDMLDSNYDRAAAMRGPGT